LSVLEQLGPLVGSIAVAAGVSVLGTVLAVFVLYLVAVEREEKRNRVAALHRYTRPDCTCEACTYATDPRFR
jgi:hypothetical protein